MDCGYWTRSIWFFGSPQSESHFHQVFMLFRKKPSRRNQFLGTGGFENNTVWRQDENNKLFCSYLLQYLLFLFIHPSPPAPQSSTIILHLYAHTKLNATYLMDQTDSSTLSSYFSLTLFTCFSPSCSLFYSIFFNVATRYACEMVAVYDLKRLMSSTVAPIIRERRVYFALNRTVPSSDFIP
jgi:hypothetical protein